MNSDDTQDSIRLRYGLYDYLYSVPKELSKQFLPKTYELTMIETNPEEILEKLNRQLESNREYCEPTDGEEIIVNGEHTFVYDDKKREYIICNAFDWIHDKYIQPIQYKKINKIKQMWLNEYNDIIIGETNENNRYRQPI